MSANNYSNLFISQKKKCQNVKEKKPTNTHNFHVLDLLSSKSILRFFLLQQTGDDDYSIMFIRDNERLSRTAKKEHILRVSTAVL